jgi:hypothetical protein
VDGALVGAGSLWPGRGPGSAHTLFFGVAKFGQKVKLKIKNLKIN